MFYFLEYRRPLGFNGPSTPMYGVPPVDAVLLRLRVVVAPGTDGDTLRPKIDLNPGTPFIDPYRGLRVEVTQKLGDHVVVRVTGTGKPLKLTDIKRTGAASQNVQVSFDSVNGANGNPVPRSAASRAISALIFVNPVKRGSPLSASMAAS